MREWFETEGVVKRQVKDEPAALRKQQSELVQRIRKLSA